MRGRLAYLAGRAGRAPWAAAPSGCSPVRSGPSWRWAADPGSAGSRPARSCSGTRRPADASWTLGDTTDPNNPEKRPGPQHPAPRRCPCGPTAPQGLSPPVPARFLPATLCTSSHCVHTQKTPHGSQAARPPQHLPVRSGYLPEPSAQQRPTRRDTSHKEGRRKQVASVLVTHFI